MHEVINSEIPTSLDDAEDIFMMNSVIATTILKYETILKEIQENTEKALTEDDKNSDKNLSPLATKAVQEAINSARSAKTQKDEQEEPLIEMSP